MKIIKAHFETILYKAPYNEPWKQDVLFMVRIEYYYENGERDYAMNSMYGIMRDEEEFCIALPNDCVITTETKIQINKDKYYEDTKSYRSACLNKSGSNPYQHPSWLSIK